MNTLAPVDLSQLVQSHVCRLFAPGERAQVTQLLSYECGYGLPGARNGTPAFFERVQCAALKVSDGQIDQLEGAIALAQSDWRDLLVAAGFAHDGNAHKEWLG